MQDSPPPLATESGALASMSLSACLTNVFVSPGEVFDSVKASQPRHANWLVPAILVIFISWLGAALVLSQDTIKHQLTEVSAKAIEKQIASKKMPKEQADAIRAAAEKYGSIGTTISIVAGPVVAAFVSPFWWGLIIWLLGKVAWKGDFSFMKAVEVAGLANTIGVVEAVIRTLLIVGQGNLFASPSLALLISEYDPQNPVHNLLGVANVMTFWLLAVRSIGLRRLSGVSMGKAALGVYGVWAGYTGLMIGFGLAMQAIFQK